jgi:aspartyl/asparaginyl-tRNA synthetase
MDLRVSFNPAIVNCQANLQTPSNQAIFRIQSGVCQLFREHLNSENFIEIHSPKLQGAATESGASVFKVQYFNGKLLLF